MLLPSMWRHGLETEQTNFREYVNLITTSYQVMNCMYNNGLVANKIYTTVAYRLAMNNTSNSQLKDEAFLPASMLQNAHE